MLLNRKQFDAVAHQGLVVSGTLFGIFALRTAALQHGDHVAGVDQHAAVVFGFDQDLAGQDFLRQDPRAAARRNDVGA
jgi:hypothetical protein